jgi:hypothetical protein
MAFFIVRHLKWLRKDFNLSSIKRHSILMVVFEIVLFFGLACGSSAVSGQNEESLIRSYTLNKKVSDFPPSQDMTTPEAAYATIMRDYMATGASDSEWSKISIWKKRGTQPRKVPPDIVQNYLNARIVEVEIFKERCAQVVAEMQEDGVIRIGINFHA